LFILVYANISVLQISLQVKRLLLLRQLRNINGDNLLAIQLMHLHIPIFQQVIVNHRFIIGQIAEVFQDFLRIPEISQGF